MFFYYIMKKGKLQARRGQGRPTLSGIKREARGHSRGQAAEGRIAELIGKRDAAQAGPRDAVLGSWTLTGAGTLTVSGAGAMPDFADLGDRPWDGHVGGILKVVIEDGVTSVGSNAFQRS